MSQSDVRESAPEASKGLLGALTPARAAAVVTVLAFVPYLITMNPSYGFVDKGEMAAVASSLGIAHPTGYPTIMLLGYLFAKLLPVRDAYALNILSGLLTAGGAGVLTLLFHELLTRFDLPRPAPTPVRKGERNRGKEAPRKGAVVAQAPPSGMESNVLPAALAALFTAFTSTWWNQGNGFEVYSLHVLLMAIVTLLFIRYVEGERAADSIDIFSKRGVWFAVMLGLSFTNHLTTILLAPAFLVFYFIRLGINGGAFLRMGGLAPWFVAGLLPYLWLPIRASMKPRFNWGDPSNMKRFFDHITGKQYQVWMFSNAETWSQQSKFFFGNLPAELGYIGLVIVALGIVRLIGRSPALGISVAVLFLTCIVWAGGYDIMEIGPYYLTAIFAIGIWALFGLSFLRERIGSRGALLAGGVLVLATLAVNYSSSDESGNTLVEDKTVNMLTTLPQNAVVFSAQWDFWVAGSFYTQEVEGLRPDVVVVDPELMRRSWYIDELRRYFPEFMATVRGETDRYLVELHKFEYELPYNDAVIEGAYIGLLRAMVEKNMEIRPVLVTGDVRPDMTSGFVLTPYYLALRVTRDPAYIPMEFPKYTFRLWDRVDGYTAKLCELYARSAVGRMLYERKHGHDSLAVRYGDLALSFDPGFDHEHIPSLPLNSEDQVRGTIDFFAALRGELGR